MRHVLGLDGGGSKVCCMVADENGRLLGCGRGHSVNTNYTKRQDAMASLRKSVDIALEKAGLVRKQIDVVCISAPTAPDALAAVFREFSFGEVIRAAEGETSLWAARYWVEGRIGVTVDAGTGAMARGWSRDGREAGAGGWGAELGDEGSSYWIGMEAMRAILKAYDGRIAPTLLTQPVLSHLGFSDMLDMVFRVDQLLVREAEVHSQVRIGPDSGAEGSGTQETWAGGIYFRDQSTGVAASTRREIASLGPVVAEVARGGDWKAKEIFREAGRELGRACAAVIERLEMAGEEFVVVPFGGVFRAGELLLPTFRSVIRAAAPAARVVAPRFEPVVGAILMALNEIGVKIRPRIIRGIEQSSGRFSDDCLCDFGKGENTG